MYKLFLTLRYLRKRRIAYFAIMAVALCVAMVLVVHSVMGGFLDMVRNSSRRLLGDVILEVGGMETFPFYDEFIAEVKDKLGTDVVAATPVIINVGLLKIMGGPAMDRIDYAMVSGIRLEEYCKINSFGDGLFYNKYFPGTTAFEPAPMPTFYIDENDLARLPVEYERAFAEYQDAASGLDLTTEFPRHLGAPYSAPGKFLQHLPQDIELGLTDSKEHLGEPLPGVIIGIEMVTWKEEQGYVRIYPKGTTVKITVMSLTRSGDISAIPSLTRAFRYVDDSRTKIYDIDSKNVYIDFHFLQNMLGLDAREYVDGSGFSPARATQIQIKLAGGVDYNNAKKDIEVLWEDFARRYAARCRDPGDAILLNYMQILTWEERNSGFIKAVEKERILMLILFGLISVVAIALVGCIFYMIVQEKTREIGIIKSMGATSGGVAGIFLTYALAIGVVGSLLGTAFGALFVRYINEFQDFIARIDPELRVWSPETYAFDRIPNIVKPWDALLIASVAVVACVVGSVIAARKAARIWPVDAIRYE